MKMIGVIVALAASLMIGCVSQSELDAVRITAENAQRTATSANECCVATSQKIDRMYQKVLSK